MSDQPATIDYTVPEPFETAIVILRDALSNRKLRVAEVFNLSQRIQQRLSISVAPCVVLLVTPAGSTLEALHLSPAAAAFLPLHVVISGRGSQSQIHIMRASQIDPECVDADTAAAVSRLLDETAEAIESVAMRLTATV